MKILFVHNKYQQLGGEDGVLAAEMDLMSSGGHEVALAGQDNAVINSFMAKVRSALDVAYSAKNRLWMSREISRFSPDVVHVHNFFPLLSPSIYDACVDSNIPLVQTLHNFRITCAGGILLRDGTVCEDCIRGWPYKAVVHRCYRDSMTGSFAVARMVQKHRKQGTWGKKINRIVALTDFAKSKFVEAGVPAGKILVKPNFVHDYSSNGDEAALEKKGAVFVGRLSKEKGLATLVRAWQGLDVPLHVVGDGPLKLTLNSLDGKTVKVLGRLDRAAVFRVMQGAAFLVMPSECYEGFPLVLAEGFMLGLPVVTSRLGSMAEIVEDGITGIHFEAGNSEDLANKVRWMYEHPEECRRMGLNARQVYEKKYTPARNYERLMHIYQQAIDDRASNGAT